MQSPFLTLTLAGCAVAMAGAAMVSAYALSAQSDANKARHAAQARVLERSTLVDCGAYSVIVVSHSVRSAGDAADFAGKVSDMNDCAWRETAFSPEPIARVLAY